MYGDRGVRALYGRPGRRRWLLHILTQHWISRVYGRTQNSPRSRRKIAPFVEQFSIPMELYLEEEYRSFNDFFIRQFKPGMRPFATGRSFPAFAEGRYLVYGSSRKEEAFAIKNDELDIQALLGRPEEVEAFVGGPVYVARLCPTDYHRFHFPDEGRLLRQYSVQGKLHSVNPLALLYKKDILSSNERVVSLLETKYFGLLAYIEIGAICVGKIYQTHSYPQRPAFSRGAEKGYFLFGASCVVVLGQKGRLLADEDLCEQTRAGIESKIELGESIGQAISSASF